VISLVFGLEGNGLGRAGQFGDTFGFVTALFTGVGFVGIVATILFQLEDFKRRTRESTEAQQQYAQAQRQATAVTSADLMLRLTEYFNSDRFLRVRHGAVTHLRLIHLQRQSATLPSTLQYWNCSKDISPYSQDSLHESGLNTDLVEVFNFFNMVGDLVEEKAIREDIALETFAFWIRFYYISCKEEVEQLLRSTAEQETWKNMTSFYDMAAGKYGAELPREAINAILIREHARTHRGAP
jgi:hypothetical protein